MLALRSGDIAAAEDALGDGFAAALTRWPHEGVPQNPTAWLLKTAQRKQIDQARRKQTHINAFASLDRRARDRQQRISKLDEHSIPDTRLRLMFVCTHPAIDANVRSALMLQTVLGIDASRIASAFLLKPSAVSARLVRAKAKIRDAAIPFIVPESDELNERVGSVLEAIYAAFTLGIEVDGQGSRGDLTSEAIWLGSILNDLLPGHPEVMGLQAMMLFQQARSPSSSGESETYVPLSERCTQTWDHRRIREAEALLTQASGLRAIGPYQIEAAIQSVHCHRHITGRTDWHAICQLYQGLVRLSPTTASHIGLAAAHCQCGDPEAAVKVLMTIETSHRDRLAAFWAVLAEAYSQIPRESEAREAYRRAIGLTESAGARRWLIARSVREILSDD